jgi:hypothetical protein
MNVDNVSESRISAGNEFHSLAPSYFRICQQPWYIGIWYILKGSLHGKSPPEIVMMILLHTCGGTLSVNCFEPLIEDKSEIYISGNLSHGVLSSVQHIICLPFQKGSGTWS